MHRMLVFALLALSLLTVAPSASAQLLAAKDGPVAYGHHHLNATNIEEQKKFFVSTLGGTAIKVGTSNAEIVKFPNVLIFFRLQAPTGGTRGTTANHIGFSVPNLRVMVDKIKANGYTMITTSEVAAGRAVKDDIAGPQQAGGASIAFALGPDEVKVELVEATQQTAPIQLHHIHLFGQQNVQMQAWYVKTFGAKPRAATPGAAFLSADLPGVALNFTPSPEPVVGTQGRAVDHIGFEVKNLEAFTKKLEADGITLERPYTKVAALDIAIAFIKDPWGTYIELTEGLDRVR
jgi:catechol 2,3-dioxygenase-like lactoylglutathione lyase family enzyme/predicted enzyme related to lactoylglutathione lyase